MAFGPCPHGASPFRLSLFSLLASVASLACIGDWSCSQGSGCLPPSLQVTSARDGSLKGQDAGVLLARGLGDTRMGGGPCR